MKIERNKPCPCGSGKKYKRCHYPLGGWPPPPRATIRAESTRPPSDEPQPRRGRHVATLLGLLGAASMKPGGEQ